MTEEKIAEISIRDGEVDRITRCCEGTRVKVQIRRWFQAADGEWRPGRRGISIRSELVARYVGGMLTAATGRRQ